MRTALLALLVCGCVDAHAGTTGLSTDKARTAAPTGGADLDGGPGAEGSSLSFMRADALLPVKGVLPVVHGGTGVSNPIGGVFVALQSGTPAPQSGKIDVDSDILQGSLTMSSDNGGFCNSTLVSCWDPEASPTASNLTAARDLNITAGTAGTLSLSAGTGDVALSLAPSGATLSNVDGAVTVSAGTDGTLTLNGTTVGGINLNANLGTISLSSASAFSSSKNVGCVALTSGTPSTKTVTVASGAHCVCSEATTAANNANLKCAVSSTTLTITGPNTVTDTICYFCG